MSELTKTTEMDYTTEDLLKALEEAETVSVKTVKTSKPRKPKLPRPFVRLQALLKAEQVKAIEISDGDAFTYVTRTGFLIFDTSLFPSDTLLAEVAPYFTDNEKLRFEEIQENKFKIFFEKDGKEELALFQIKENRRRKKAEPVEPIKETDNVETEDAATEMPEL